jgi:hypothetical protein
MERLIESHLHTSAFLLELLADQAEAGTTISLDDAANNVNRITRIIDEMKGMCESKHFQTNFDLLTLAQQNDLMQTVSAFMKLRSWFSQVILYYKHNKTPDKWNRKEYLA